ncbi:MAG: YybS family protein, partial [Syntrophaceae bacterium]|nr:YybS family protein [Syntrophaceae bacterium]
AGALILLAPGNLPLMIGMNIVILCSLLYFFQGLAIATYLFKARRVPVALRWVFYILLAIQQYLAILVIAVGLFDLWVDFRRRIGKIDSQA